MYHTHTDSSDYDFRGVYKPTLRDCYLNQIKDVVEPAHEEIYYSIQKFLDLAIGGQPVALEMLWASVENSFSTGFEWPLIRQYRKEFFNKKMDAFLGFGRSLANKYAVKAERFNALNELIDKISTFSSSGFDRQNKFLSEIWDSLPENDFCSKETDAENRIFYVVLSRKYRDNTKLKDFLVALKEIKENYGERVRAAQNGEYDSKSVSHCFRICYQLQDMANYGEFIFPLSQADFLRKLKNKEVDHVRDDIFNRLEDEIKITENMLASCSLPDKVRDGIREEILDKIYG